MPSSNGLNYFPGKRFHELPLERRGYKNCKQCGELFERKSGTQKYCTTLCKERVNQAIGSMSVANQYMRISGNPTRYFARLINKKRRELLTTQDLLDLLEAQGGKCALSGQVLTFTLQHGVKTLTNASIDQIIPGKGYHKDNIRLVCRVLNSWRGDTPTEEFVKWCKLVSDHEDRSRVRAIQ